MGLGKTIQGIGVAELLAQLADIKRVLIVCPASLKSQWRNEIAKFSGRSTQIVLGNGAERIEQYGNDTFFTICNYEQVLRDVTAIENVPWDLIVLDEGQRIKNWESKTSNVIRMLDSSFRLVLSGTPLENRLGELYTVTKFVDDELLGPAYQFFNKHHLVDERGKTQGYHHLDELREKMSGVLLRRTRAEIADQLPERTDEIVRIEATQEQYDIQDANCARAAQIAAKKFMTEMDRLVLMSCLTNARMACDSTYLLDQEQQEYSSKLERLTELLAALFEDPTRKIVLFSEWKRMLDRIESRIEELGADFVRLDGQVPQKKASRTDREISERSELPSHLHDQRRFDGPEPAGRQHGDQRRPAVEPGGAGTADRPSLPHGSEESGSHLQAGDGQPQHGRNDRRTSAGHSGREAGSGRRIDQFRQRRQRSVDGQRHGET